MRKEKLVAVRTVMRMKVDRKEEVEVRREVVGCN